MSARLVHMLSRVTLLVALTVALAGTGFAHRIATPQNDALAFALANGVGLADICGDGLKGSVHAGADCEACQITGAADMPPLTGLQVKLELAFHAAVIEPLEIRAVRQTLDPAHRPQGPPVA